jgi:hypothetical protein
MISHVLLKARKDILDHLAKGFYKDEEKRRKIAEVILHYADAARPEGLVRIVD